MNKQREKGRKWDGKSRPSNNLYKKNYDKIFKKNNEPKNRLEQMEKLKHDPVLD
tara:strand:+ start:2365 stop:2526 length:162 start_codon:yes stop_codon:yes gene_type:complete